MYLVTRTVESGSISVVASADTSDIALKEAEALALEGITTKLWLLQGTCKPKRSAEWEKATAIDNGV